MNPPSEPPKPPRASTPPPPPDSNEPSGERKSTVERVVSDLLRRGLEAGLGTLKHTDEALRATPKEVASFVIAQLGDARSGLVRAVASEVGTFLREADIASEIKKMLSGMSVEVKGTVSFIPAEDGTVQPKLKVSAARPIHARRRKQRTVRSADNKPPTDEK
jgi:hypothetical protein